MAGMLPCSAFTKDTLQNQLSRPQQYKLRSCKVKFRYKQATTRVWGRVPSLLAIFKIYFKNNAFLSNFGWIFQLS